jgi:hypothetical protein
MVKALLKTIANDNHNMFIVQATGLKLTNVEDVFESLIDHKRHPLTLPLQQGVRRHGCAHPDPTNPGVKVIKLFFLRRADEGIDQACDCPLQA